MDWIFEANAWISLATLTLLEIVLGIDNVVFISILSGRLPEHQQRKARLYGLSLALGGRVLLLFSIGWIMSLQAELFSVLDQSISGRDLILLGGGLFLIWKATKEIHAKLEGDQQEHLAPKVAPSGAVLVQILILDIVFSLDSVITAVGMADQIGVMVTAVLIAIVIMMISAKSISSFIEHHPTVKMLALSFLILIGTALIADGLDLHIPKGYIYFAMAFSVMVEVLNLRMRRKSKPIPLRRATGVPGIDSE